MGEGDADLVRSALSGDSKGYCLLVERYAGAATRWALYYVKDLSRAEEIVQEAFVEAYFQLQTLRQPERFGSWLRSIVTYTAIAWLRRRRPMVLVEEIHSAASGHQRYSRYEAPTPQEALEQEEQEALLHLAIAALSPAHQQVIALFYFERYSHQQLADRLHSSVPAVKSLLHRARQQLRKEMSKHER